ncbi:MAG: TonB family protein [Bacteroidales bacterium]
MNAIFSYLLESSISITLMYTVYWLFLKRETFFMMNRVYLLGAAGLSLLLPVIPFHWQPSSAAATVIYILDPVLITPDKIEKAAGSHLQWLDVVAIVYITGLVIFLLRFVVQMLQLFFIVRRNGTERRHGMLIVYVDRGYSPFSFFNLVFINEKNVPGEKLETILTHEYIHVKQRHTLDLILAEILIIIQWFNPFAWFTGREFRTIHEFLADEGVIKAGINRSEYQQMILDETMGIQVNGLTNNFNVSLIKKRILMISKAKSGKWSRTKLIFAIPAILALVFLISARSYSSSVGQDKTTVKASSQTTATPQSQSTATVNEKVKFVKPTESKVYDSVDVIPEFPGGWAGLGQFILKNLKYPESAKKSQTQGKVLVSFIVWSNGSVGDVKIQQGIGHGCDEEAVRVVKMMPKWKPGEKGGKVVNVHFILPINFTLGEGKKEEPKK